jgi:hypothetical protein
LLVRKNASISSGSRQDEALRFIQQNPAREAVNMLPKFMPDLFQPIHLPRINWQRMGWVGVRPLRVSSGYRACRWMQSLKQPANEN